jgi:hypothetical protein
MPSLLTPILAFIGIAALGAVVGLIEAFRKDPRPASVKLKLFRARVRRFRLCWADKLAIAIAVCIWLFLTVIAADKAGLYSFDVAGEFFEMLLIVWIPLRLLDWAIGGPRRRRMPSRFTDAAH